MEMHDPQPGFGMRVAMAALEQMGTAFRPQGRGEAGLDCLGLVLLSMGAAGVELDVPKLALRGHGEQQVLHRLSSLGFQPLSVGASACGDILLSFPATRQAHLAIRTWQGFVEANAALRHVVERLWDGGEGWHSAWRLHWEQS